MTRERDEGECLRMRIGPRAVVKLRRYRSARAVQKLIWHPGCSWDLSRGIPSTRPCPCAESAPRVGRAVERWPDWAGLPVIATVARALCPGVMEPRAVIPSRGGSRGRGRPRPASGAVGRGRRSQHRQTRRTPPARLAAESDLGVVLRLSDRDMWRCSASPPPIQERWRSSRIP